jgi:5'-nucleotidase
MTTVNASPEAEENIQSRGAAADTLRKNPLRIGISTRALFDLEEEHRVFEDQGVKAYAAMQLDREDVTLAKGAGFEVVERLLALNDPGTAPYVEVILLSQNSPDLSLRAFKSIDHYGLAVKTGASPVVALCRPSYQRGALTFFFQIWIRTYKVLLPEVRLPRD